LVAPTTELGVKKEDGQVKGLDNSSSEDDADRSKLMNFSLLDD
jgi:hypothetical protein